VLTQTPELYSRSLREGRGRGRVGEGVGKMKK